MSASFSKHFKYDQLSWVIRPELLELQSGPAAESSLALGPTQNWQL